MGMDFRWHSDGYRTGCHPWSEAEWAPTGAAYPAFTLPLIGFPQCWKEIQQNPRAPEEKEISLTLLSRTLLASCESPLEEVTAVRIYRRRLQNDADSLWLNTQLNSVFSSKMPKCDYWNLIIKHPKWNIFQDVDITWKLIISNSPAFS